MIVLESIEYIVWSVYFKTIIFYITAYYAVHSNYDDEIEKNFDN